MLPILLAIETGLDVTRNAAGYTGTGSVTLIVGRAIQIALGALGIVFILFLIYGQVVRCLTPPQASCLMPQASCLTPHRKAAFTSGLTNTTIALVVIVASYAIATYVVGALVQVTAG